MAEPGERPTIVVYANCAGKIVAQELRRLPTLAAQFDIHWVRNFSASAPGDEPFDETMLVRCRFYLEQVGNFRGDKRRGGSALSVLALPPGCRTLRFPPLFMTTLWPFVALDPRSEPFRSEWCPEGPYPKYVCNRLLLDLLREDADPERVFRRFMRLRVQDHVDLDRLHEITLAKIGALDRDSDVQVGDFITREFTRRRLFLMQLHPAGAMLRHLCEAVFRHLDVPDPEASARLEEIERDRGIGQYDAPIHPDIVEHFGLAWAHGLTYRHYSEGQFDYEEFIRRSIGLAWTPGFYRGSFLGHQGQFASAEPLLREAASLHPTPEFNAAHRWAHEALAALPPVASAD